MRQGNDIHRFRREKYSDPSPYPQIKVSRPNPHYAELLMDDYAGMVSEFSAISQYLYHHYFFKEIDPELGELLEGVSIIEMYHMEILAEIIRKLGGNPVIRGAESTRGNFWNGSYVRYGSQLCEQLKSDIDIEYEAIAAYRKHICLIQDRSVQAILHRIILDEIVHIRHFNRALLKFCGYAYRPVE